MTGSGSLDVALAREEALHRFRDINWATYTRAGGFSLEKAEITALKDLEGAIKPGADDATNVKAVDEFMSDGLRLHKRMVYFVPEGSTVDAAPFLRMIRNDTGYLQYAASHLLALFLTIRPRQEDAEALCQWAIQALKTGALPTSTNDSTRANVTRAAVASLMVLLRNEKFRVVFVKLGGVLPVVDLLESSQNRAQLAYELTFILWTLAFCDEAMEKFVAAKALDAIVQQVAAAPREKVVRVALEALQNLLGKLSGFFNERMIDSGLLKTLNNMRERKWADEDIAKGIQAIRDVLIREYKELNTMERYEKELRTGTLNWGLLHTDKFWKDNFMTFENKDFELIRLLIDLLESDDPKTVAVALFDLGEFVRFYPNGKHIAKRLGAKKMTMKLMTHENAEVQKQALQCISKMMVNKWEFVK
ncbi:Salicylate hydroxylase [Phytophthora nicotianae]|uniref:Salicylate hydroxylase n=1 Tax=Phytophthora nicotianae TaxID=4792 RepID=A0A0W8D652_PHYNI|nr:Salicylate hydroxylase [Phytophthora nicotianae]